MAGPISIAILGDSRDLVRSLDTADSKMGKMGKAAGIMGKAVAGGLLAAGAGAVAWGASSLKSLARIETINAQTGAVIKSTGGTANVTSKHLQNLTGSLENLTATEAESIQEGANFLLTFKDIKNGVGAGNDIFDQTTKTMVDLSRATGTSMKGASLQLGKALNDPIKGVSALGRVGVTFTDQQKKTIKSLVDSGKTMEAQKIILGELNSEFGGSGADYGKTTAGQVELAKHAFGTLGETIFAKLLPPLADLATGVVAGLTKLNGYVPTMAAFGQTILTAVSPAITAVRAGLAQLVPVIMTAVGFVTGQLLPAALRLGGYLRATLVPIFVAVGAIITGQVIPIIRSLATFLYTKLYPAVLKIVTSVATKLKPVFDQLATSFRTQILPAVSALLVKFKAWQPTIQRVVMIVVKVAGAVLGFAAAILGKVLPPVIRFAAFMMVTMWGAISKVIGIVVKIVAKIIDFGAALGRGAVKVNEFAAKINQKVADVVTYFVSLPGKVLDAIGDVGKTLFNAGASIIQGLIDGVESKIQVVKDKLGALTDLIPKLKGPAPRDAKLLEPAGRLIMAGLLDGLDVGERLLVTKLGDLTELIAGTRLGTLSAALELHTSTTARPSLDAAYQSAVAARAATARPQEIRVTLTAEQVHQLERGRALALDLKAYTRAGGTLA